MKVYSKKGQHILENKRVSISHSLPDSEEDSISLQDNTLHEALNNVEPWNNVELLDSTTDKELISEIDSMETCFISLQGNNYPDNPWFLDLDLSKEFETFLQKLEILELIREVNRITKWGTKTKLKLKFVSYFLPHIRNYVLHKYQKKVVKKIFMYIENKNPIWRREKGITLNFWYSKCQTLGQLILRSCSNNGHKLKPFQILLSGNSTQINPLKVSINESVLKNHFSKLIYMKYLRKGDLQKGYTLFKQGLIHIGEILKEINPVDDPVVFSYFSSCLLSEIERLNQKIFQKFKVKCGMFITENLKLKDQKRNYRYTKLYYINSRSLDRLNDFQKTLKFYLKNDRIIKQFMLIFLPFETVSRLSYASRISFTSQQSGDLKKKKKVDKIENVRSQRLIFRDLTKDSKAYKSFMKMKKKEFFSKIYIGIYQWLLKFFLKPYLVRMNRFERIIARLVLVTIIYIDWVSLNFYFSSPTPLVFTGSVVNCDELPLKCDHSSGILGPVSIALLPPSYILRICPAELHFHSKFKNNSLRSHAKSMEHYGNDILVPSNTGDSLHLFQS